MSALNDTALWLADFHVMAMALSAFALAAMLLMKQPARRMAVAKATLAGLAALSVLCALPGWSLVHLVSQQERNPIEGSLVVPAERPMTQFIPHINVDQIPPPETPSAPVAQPRVVVSSESLLSRISWTTLALSLHAIGSLAVAAWLVGGALMARRIVRRAIAAPLEWREALAHVVGDRAAPELLVSSDVTSPVAVGLWWPKVLLPHIEYPPAPSPWRGGMGRGEEAPNDNAYSTAFTPPPAPPRQGEGSDRNLSGANLLYPDQLTSILAHEWAHIRNGDLWTLAASRWLLVLLWPQPLFWWLRRLVRLDQETLADAAACEAAGRVGYAEQLLKWARQTNRGDKPHGSLGASRLAGAVGLWEGPSQLKRRVAILLNEKFAVMRSCSRRWRAVCLVATSLAAVGLSLVTLQPASQAAEDDALATVHEVIALMQSLDSSIETLTAKYLCLDRFQFLKPGAQRPAEMLIEDDAVAIVRKAKVSWEATRDGRGRMEAAIERTDIRIDDSTRERTEKVVSAFDGSRGQWLNIRSGEDESQSPPVARSTANFQRTHSTPFDFASHHNGKPIVRLLADGHAKVLRKDEWEGRPVVVIQVDPVKVREDYIYQQQFWIDIDRKAAVRRQSFVQRGVGKPWGLHYQVDCKDYSEAAPAFWLPRKVTVHNYHVTEEGQDFLTGRHQYDIAQWKVNEPIDSSRFTIEYPEETIDIDRPRLRQPVPTKDKGAVLPSDGGSPPAQGWWLVRKSLVDGIPTGFSMPKSPGLLDSIEASFKERPVSDSIDSSAELHFKEAESTPASK